MNEFRFSYIKRDLQFPENDPKTPSSGITGLFQIGGDSNFPQGRVQNSYQFSDVFTLTRSKHTLKFGADVRRIKLANDAAFNSKGTYTLEDASRRPRLDRVQFVAQRGAASSSPFCHCRACSPAL